MLARSLFNAAPPQEGLNDLDCVPLRGTGCVTSARCRFYKGQSKRERRRLVPTRQKRERQRFFSFFFFTFGVDARQRRDDGDGLLGLLATRGRGSVLRGRRLRDFGHGGLCGRGHVSFFVWSFLWGEVERTRGWRRRSKNSGGRERFFFFLALFLLFLHFPLSPPLSSHHSPSPRRRPQALGSLSKDVKMVRESDVHFSACRPPRPPRGRGRRKEAEMEFFSADGCPIELSKAKRSGGRRRRQSLSSCLSMLLRKTIAPSMPARSSPLVLLLFSRAVSSRYPPSESRIRSKHSRPTRSTTTSTSSLPSRARR